MSNIYFTKYDSHYGCFSNFTMRSIVFDGITYGSSEAAWQAQKTLDLNVRKLFVDLKPWDAKRFGKQVVLRDDWEDVKYQMMIDVLYQKFTQNEDFKHVLLGTGHATLIENTTGRHDNVWGVCNCPECKGKVHGNSLGRALMTVRDRIRVDEEI